MKPENHIDLRLSQVVGKHCQYVPQCMCGFRFLRHATFVFRTPEEARNLSTLLSRLCPNSQLVEIGLFELLLNAIEHGNLEIGTEGKLELLKQGNLAQEIQHRLQQPEYIERKITLNFSEQEDRFTFDIKDEGRGFDPDPYLNKSKSMPDTFAGRGIYLANKVCLSQLQYQDQGRQVIATLCK